MMETTAFAGFSSVGRRECFGIDKLFENFLDFFVSHIVVRVGRLDAD